MKSLMFVAALVISLVAPSVASADQTAQAMYEQCAVGVRVENGPGYAEIVRMYYGTRSGYVTSLDGAVCTDLIGQGWFGMSKYGEWERRRGGLFTPVCWVEWPDATGVNIYARVGWEWMAQADCDAFDWVQPRHGTF